MCGSTEDAVRGRSQGAAAPAYQCVTGQEAAPQGCISEDYGGVGQAERGIRVGFEGGGSGSGEGIGFPTRCTVGSRCCCREDELADQDYIRLLAIVGSEEGRVTCDPIALLLPQMTSAVAGLDTSDESKQLFLTSLQLTPAQHVPVSTALPMELDLGP